MSDTFTCAECGGIFEKARSDEDAWAEDKSVFGDALTPENAVMVCENCYQELVNGADTDE